MHYWPWWLGGIALASVALGHWVALERQMAVSGRFTALVNRWRFGSAEPSESAARKVSQAALVEAMRAATAAEFGKLELDEAAGTPQPPVTISAAPLRKRQTSAVHAIFLTSLVAGGLLSALLAGNVHYSLSLESERFGALFGNEGWPGPAALALGGVLVGFGTRMAAGCTSGHGLCGVSRFQKGSLVATACFFAAGVAVSFALGALG